MPARKTSKNDAAGATRRKQRSSAEIAERLLDAAREAFKQYGYAGATTAAIARSADVTEAQLFRRFGSKAALFREAVFEPLNGHFSDFNARHLADSVAAGEARERRREYITELQDFLGEQSGLLMSLLVARAYNPDSAHEVTDIDSLRAYFERGAAMMAGRVEKDPRVDPKLLVRVSFAAVLGCVLFKDVLFPAEMASDDDISAAVIDFVIDGINVNGEPGSADSSATG